MTAHHEGSKVHEEHEDAVRYKAFIVCFVSLRDFVQSDRASCQPCQVEESGRCCRRRDGVQADEQAGHRPRAGYRLHSARSSAGIGSAHDVLARSAGSGGRSAFSNRHRPRAPSEQSTRCPSGSESSHVWSSSEASTPSLLARQRIEPHRAAPSHFSNTGYHCGDQHFPAEPYVGRRATRRNTIR
jgi:hypothetical protein